ncbi:hypothetical protein UA08_02584 [Talaromyces atroroseus]|uniref:Ribosomal protein S21 n=1 Tax=Talaromyces atroroseus TaxID=1441469 RepID=A0A225B3T3_TALAT|nr:hypothetical protein UA08_02584 [Talaromyces atroroseus]OKL61946.1 hypothetical protein UA08_02584 [Talaromyces atroroseus]
MAVQTSLARCFRATPSSTLLRPMSMSMSMSQSSTSSSHLAVCGQLYQMCQRSGFASDDSPNSTKAKESTTPDSSSTSHSILEKLNLGSSTTIPTQPTTGDSGSGAADSTADQAAKLEERMQDIRSKMQELTTPNKVSLPGRSFFGLRGSKPSAEAEAERTLEGLAKRGSQSQEQQQQQRPELLKRAQSSFSSSPSIRDVDEISPPPRLKPIAMKLGTKLGRQVLVQNEKGVDCASALRTLQLSCNSNGIRRQANLQKFHVRRGQRRKDLRSQRWRKLFKFSFEETVKKIQRMRDQGW